MVAEDERKFVQSGVVSAEFIETGASAVEVDNLLNFVPNGHDQAF